MKEFPRSRLLQYIGRTNYSEAEEKFLFYCGRDRWQKDPVLAGTVIKVTGSKKTGLDVVVGGMKVAYLPLDPRDLFPVDYINLLDTKHGKTATDRVLATLQFESIRERTLAMSGIKPKGNDREEWVEDFLEMFYPHYNRQKTPPPPLLEKMYSHVGTIGHLDYGTSVLSRAVRGEPVVMPDWIRNSWSDYLSQTSDIGETYEDPIYTQAQQEAIKELETMFGDQLLKLKSGSGKTGRIDKV